MKTLGIDPSVTSTGLIALESVGKGYPTLLHEELINPKKLKDMPRVSFIIGRIIAAIELIKPDLIAIENYGLSFKRKNSIVPLITLGAVIRYYFQQENIRYIDPTPGDHKKFIAGNGSTPKDEIPFHVHENWAYATESPDLADAYGLACMALANRNQLANPTLIMREVAATIKLI